MHIAGASGRPEFNRMETTMTKSKITAVTLTALTLAGTLAATSSTAQAHYWGTGVGIGIAAGALIGAAIYRFIGFWREPQAGGANPGRVVWKTVKELGTILKESSFLTAKTSAMVCWLFVGSGIFSAAFALLGGQEVIEKWVLSLNMTPVQFMILAQFIIFILGFFIEWIEISYIAVPLFLPIFIAAKVDMVWLATLICVNLQTSFLTPPFGWALFFLRGVAPPEITTGDIYRGIVPFVAMQILALVICFFFPQLALWLPRTIGW